MGSSLTFSQDKPKADDSDDSDDPDNEIPTLTPSLKAFSQLPLKSYEQSWEFLKRDNGVFVPGAVDALFIAGFEAEMRGESKYARQCIHQGTIVQFCEKLGKDGVSLFFKKYGALLLFDRV